MKSVHFGPFSVHYFAPILKSVCSPRIYCLFRAPRTEKDDEEAEIDSSDAKDRQAQDFAGHKNAQGN